METEARAVLERALQELAPGGEPDRRLAALEALSVAARAERDQLWASTAAGPRLRAELGEREDFEQLVARIERLAGTELPALIEGRAGPGLELVALAIHQTGSRRAGPFVRVQGHEPLSWAEVWAGARGGTVLLLEVGALSGESQSELLTLLVEGAAEAPRLLATSRWDPSGVLDAGLAARLGLRLRLGPRLGRVGAPSGDSASEDAGPSLEAIEQQAIATRLEACDWQQQRTADSLGIDRKTLYRKIRRYGLRPEP